MYFCTTLNLSLRFYMIYWDWWLYLFQEYFFIYYLTIFVTQFSFISMRFRFWSFVCWDIFCLYLTVSSFNPCCSEKLVGFDIFKTPVLFCAREYLHLHILSYIYVFRGHNLNRIQTHTHTRKIGGYFKSLPRVEDYIIKQVSVMH